MLRDRFSGHLGQAISYLLTITTTLLPLRMAYAQEEFDKAVADANAFADVLLEQRVNPTYDEQGNLLVDGKVYMSQKEITGQRDNDYLPANIDVYGSDAATIMQGQAAQRKYEEKTLETAETSGERAYLILQKSLRTQKPDLSNDPIWSNTDKVFENLEEISKDFANCTIDKELVYSGDSYHVPVYKTCDRLPAIEENYSIFHEYKVGVIKHHSGPTNLSACGDGCTTLWLGTVGNNYWSGNCRIFEESMSLEVIQPDAITSAVINYAKFDDWFQIYLNGDKVYNGPYADQFPPETSGRCELSESWVKNPNINVISSFRDVPENTVVEFKNRTSVSGHGEGYAKITVHYNVEDLVYDEYWSEQELIDKAYKIKAQADDGFCEAKITCVNMPTDVDENGCGTVNGVRVCEENFKENPLAGLGISPFCQRIDIESNCNFNEGQVCTTNPAGVETCFDNDTIERNQCEKYESDSNCSFIKTECVEGAQGESGECYVQQDTYDCGFDASTGTPSEEEVLRCDGQIQCIGESCYSPDRDLANGDFGEVNAYLEMLRYAQADMTCVGVPERPFDPENPPDKYEPVPSCPAGFVYDKTTDKCLKQTKCEFSDEDFYVASRRNGVQVVLDNKVIANEPSILSCATIIKNGTAYTCGEARQNIATDTFYEVCTNEIDEPTPDTCPSEEHELNEETGYCEVPPIMACPDGYELHDGPDIWSTDDDFCRLEAPVTYNCDKAHETYNPENGVCEGLLYEIATCEDPMDLANDICSATITDDVKCPSGQSFDPNKELCSQILENNATCPTGAVLENDRCNGLLVETAECPSGQSLKDGVCTVTLTDNAQCPNSAILEDGKCVLDESAPPQCPNGYWFEHYQCIKVDTEAPTYSCPDGYNWNESTCEKEEKNCQYSQSSPTFHVLAARNSPTTAHWNNKLVSERASIGRTFKGNDGYTYITSRMMASYNSATYYNICRFETSHVDPDTTCRDNWQPNGGLCELVSVEKPTCPDGFELNPDTGMCEKKTITSPMCQDGYGFNFETNKCEKTLTSNPICNTGFNFNIVTNQCEKTIDTAPICPNGFGYDPVANKCKKVIESSPECQTGYEYFEGECSKYISTGPTCPDGYAYSTITDRCEQITSSIPRLSCDVEGTAYHEPTNTCRLDIDAIATCPDRYPVWNGNENRCMSGSLNPIVKIRNKIGSNTELNVDDPHEMQALIAYAVAPMQHLSSVLLPTAYAEETVPSEPVDTITQESMNEYIAEKFKFAAETFEYQKEMFSQGQRQLFRTLSRNAPDSGQGTTNVQCELFKGEAMECKQAVGGMQDCCESPVATTLGDYITLTRHMMSMDAMTGEIFGMENYSGVWEMASNWGSAAADSAWSVVQGEFVSPADIVAQAGSDGMVEGAVNSMAQSMMNYTNTFLTNSFGPEVASMFFTGSPPTVGFSPQMAAVGNALMYCYYAYLAYVVFNLLVNIIFECEEEEFDLAMKVELLSTHYIGTYCKTDVLGLCIEKRKSYCAFDSPLSRILMEQIYKQPHMGLSWGTAKNPNCTGLSIEEIDKVDWDEVNLDEWIGILIKTDNFIQNDEIDIERLTGEKSLLNYGEEDDDKRQNVLEKNNERFKEIEVDEVRRDAYEDAWNEYQ
ncbi:hypothetical protein VA249_45580 (plasmid) [Vibrio alfacsensis]|uniref:conjugal transfer protein TraN n=1 Tax=Vibrio alfacsensis TaxID=1074311 RepID=UPI001BEDDDC2|nr:conjugal transfer protein TraN [Vibrio alfacsensis]BBM67912.1 hypothetical protein VA249_45580 [Vibrio alfacsensis]